MNSIESSVITVFFFFLSVWGSILLWYEILSGGWKNFATSVFIAVFVPLNIFVPFLIHFFIGGSFSIVKGSDHIINESIVYYQYIGLTFLILFSLSVIRCCRKTIIYPILSQVWTPSPLILRFYLAIFCVGFYMYVESTGISLFNLIIASRFSWFQNDSYNSTLYVISSYFISVLPVLVFFASDKKNGCKIILILTILIAFFYGLVTKDRKWLIYIGSAFLARLYLESRGQIVLSLIQRIFVLLFISFLAFFQIFREVVFRYFLGEVSSFMDEVSVKFYALLTGGDIAYYYRASIEAIYQASIKNNYVVLGVLRRTLFFFLPTDYSGGLKVEDISATFSDWIDGGDDIRRGNMPPGFYGLFILSFGWTFSAFLLTIMPYFLAKIDQCFKRSQLLVILPFTLFSVMLFLRGDDSSAIYFPIFNMAIFWFFKKIMRIRF